MKILLAALIVMLFFLSCNSDEKKLQSIKDNKISLRTDTVNVVKLSDTLVINESTCRGCAYEQSTHFDISDSMKLIRLQGIVTTDKNSSDMSGGNVSKQLILLPINTGTTTIKLYKFWKQEETAKDSANAVSYKLEIRN